VMFVLEAKKAGADFLLVNSPPYAVPTDLENAKYALQIDLAADLPIMLYNYTGRTGAHMGEEFLDEVGKSANFCGIKESLGDINRVHLLAYDYPNIGLCCGMDDQALEFFVWGARC
jgi:4-hydroxy-tetrahydrodipicolinate synthase